MSERTARRFYICREIDDHAAWFLQGSWVARRGDAQRLAFHQAVAIVASLRDDDGPGIYTIVEAKNER